MIEDNIYLREQSELLAARIRSRAERARMWLRHYDQVTLVLDRTRVSLTQVQEESDFPLPMRTEILSLLAELFAYKQVVEERKQCLEYLIEGRTENDPAPNPKKLGSHIKFIRALEEVIRSLDGEPLPEFRTLETFLENYQPRVSVYKSDDSFWLWKAERKAYALRKNVILPKIREARSILNTEEDNLSKFQELVRELKNDPDLCDV